MITPKQAWDIDAYTYSRHMSPRLGCYVAALTFKVYDGNIFMYVCQNLPTAQLDTLADVAAAEAVSVQENKV